MTIVNKIAKNYQALNPVGCVFTTHRCAPNPQVHPKSILSRCPKAKRRKTCG